MTTPPLTTPASRREALFVVVLWVLSCAYTVGYAALFGYQAEPQPRLVLGMPSWVFWGIVAPWLVCTLVTCWFSLRGIKDEDLGTEDETGPTIEAGHE
jgi:hypothetical protein